MNAEFADRVEQCCRPLQNPASSWVRVASQGGAAQRGYQY
jgi:hypothetical protein